MPDSGIRFRFAISAAVRYLRRTVFLLVVLASLTLISTLATPAFASGLYRLVDEDGVTHFTNAPTDPRFRRIGALSGTAQGWLRLPEGARLISVMRDGRAEIAGGTTELKPGDQVLAILEPGKEDELKRVLLKQ